MVNGTMAGAVLSGSSLGGAVIPRGLMWSEVVRRQDAAMRETIAARLARDSAR